MPRRPTFFIAISDGKIEVRLAGDEDTAKPLVFDDEDEAARTIAARMLETGAETVMNSSTCNWPEQEGRPSFDLERFHDRIRHALGQDQSPIASPAADG